LEENMQRNATAVWNGGLKDGAGTVSTQSGTLKDTKYDFKMRFEDAPGTNPEELIAAAHAACFSMALSAQLAERGINGEIQTKATVTMENLTLTKSHLELVVKSPGADAGEAEQAWNAAKAGCPISKVLNLEITLDARLEG
jgi:osmotically inducible protein OsmC